MKIILCVPNFRWIEADPNTMWHFLPYNLCMLASMIRDKHDVEIIDAHQANMSKDAFSEKIKQARPDVVGITVLMDEYGEAGHECARLVKRVNSSIETVIGGVYSTMNAEDVIQDINIDYVVMGEGEYVFKDLLGYFMGNNSMPAKGLCYKDGHAIINQGHSDFIKDLDALPAPAYDLIDFNAYANNAIRKSVDSPRKYPYARIMTSRGCPFDCVFCQVGQISGKQFRVRSAENVLDEIEWLKSTYGIQSIIFDDDNLLFDRERARELFQGMIDRGLTMSWVMIATAVFELDEELITLMRESGCEYIDVAIESGTERVLKQVIHKPLDFEYAKKMVKVSREAGIFVTANFIVGFPTETWNEIRATLKFAEEINADYVKVFSAIPLRSTKLWDMCQKQGVFKRRFDADKVRWSTGQIETDEFFADDLTLLRAYEWDRINFTDKKKCEKICAIMGITTDEMKMIRKKTLSNARRLINEGVRHGQAIYS